MNKSPPNNFANKLYFYFNCNQYKKNALKRIYFPIFLLLVLKKHLVIFKYNKKLNINTYKHIYKHIRYIKLITFKAFSCHPSLHRLSLILFTWISIDEERKKIGNERKIILILYSYFYHIRSLFYVWSIQLYNK
jgi:hypothetical protein